jgi:hypothetical protein
MADRIHLGFEVGTGKPVSVPLHHLAATGLTRQAGKTTAIEGMLGRLPVGFKALLFSTKRGELTFAQAGRVEPFYRQHTDWEYVESLLEAAMKERMRLERSFIINASKGAKTLRQVYNNIVRGRKEARRGFDEAIFTNLQAYFEKVLPQLEAYPFASTLNINPGPNVMDLGHLSEEVQALVIAACLEEVWSTGSNTILVIPEAWAFLPQQRGNPVKWAAQHVIREGGAVGVYLYLDSQDITGITKDVLKSVDVWLLGRQREKNEVQRVLDQLPIPTKEKPKPEEVMTLPVGHFLVAAEDWCKKVYVQPAWLDEQTARKVALGEIVPERNKAAEPVGTLDYSGQLPTPENCPPEEDPMVIAELEGRLSEAQAEVEALQKRLEEEQRTAAEARGLVGALRVEKLSLEDDLASYKTLQEVLRAIISPGAAPGPLIVLPTEIEIDTLAQKVAARLGTSPVIQRAPIEVLQHQFQQEAVDRLVAQVQALEERPRQAITWLLAVGRPAKHMEICRRLAFPEAGASFARFGTGIKKAVVGGFLVVEPDGLRVTIWERVATELEPYGATQQETEATYQQVVAALANDASASS